MSANPLVAGVGLHPFGRWPDLTAGDMVRKAAGDALAAANVPFSDVEMVFCGRVQTASGGGFEVISELGMTGVPIFTTDVACASSSAAFKQACMAILAGAADVTLVVGYERMRKGVIAINEGTYKEAIGAGLMPPRYALKARDYQTRYGASADAFAAVSVKAHRNGTLNPNAHHQKELTLEEVMGSRMIAEPLTLYQCCPTSDGAAALVVMSDSAARRYGSTTIRVLAAEMAAPSFADLQHNTETDADLHDATTTRVAQKAYEVAGVGPGDVGVTQLHDAFTSGELSRIEALGLCGEGEAADLTLRGETAINGRLPVNTDGGLLSRGHPLGATGAAQIAEIYLQLLGDAGPRQIAEPPLIGLCQNAGGGASMGVVVEIFSR
ncbi:MAG: thiolase family protein [Dehalococcoidia bacterium]|nr:thiolase family protein [Dehalococcoidia bacterium]